MAMASLRSQECTFIEDYCVAPSPSRDYYGLKVTDQQVLLYVWKVTRGSAGHPVMRRETLADFLRNNATQNEICRIFGGETAAQAVAIAKGDRGYLAHLPQGILQRILLHVDISDIAHLSQVCSKLHQATNHNSLWQVLYERVNGGPPTQDQRKRAALVGWKRVFRSTFKYPFEIRTPTLSTEVARRPKNKMAGVAGTSSRPTIQPPETKIYPMVKNRGHAQSEGNRNTPEKQAYLSNKLQELAAQRKKTDVKVLFAAATRAGDNKSVTSDAGRTAVTLGGNDQSRSVKLLETVEGRVLKEGAVRKSSGTSPQEGKSPDERNTGYTANSYSSTTDEDNRANIQSEGVKTNLLDVKSKKTRTERKESKPLVLKESDSEGLKSSPRKSKKIQTVGDQRPSTSRSKLTDIDRGKLTSEVHAAKKTRPLPAVMSMPVSDRGTVGKAADSSRKYSKGNQVADEDKKMPTTSRKEGKASVQEKTTSNKHADPKHIIMPPNPNNLNKSKSAKESVAKKQTKK